MNRSIAFATISALSWCVAAQSQPIDNKVVYGPDDRRDVYEISDQALIGLGNSTCVLVSAGRLTPSANDTFTATFTDYRISGFDPCPTEPYGDQPLLGFCSGFLVDEDLIVTAGHCYSETSISNTRFVFGFEMLDASTPVQVFDASQVYAGIEVVGRALTGQDDWSVVRLDRPVDAPGAIPLPIRRMGTPQVGTPLGVIGYPSGLPKKIAFGDTTEVKINANLFFFDANVDTYGGNSGSPIFNRNSMLVEGVLVRGQTDFQIQDNCFISNALTDENGGGGQFEECSKVSRFAKLIPVDGNFPGDVDGDGFLDADDIQFVINEALGFDTGLDADLNGDNKVNAIDVQLVILFELGG